MAFAEGNPKERIKNVMKSNTKKIIGFAGLGAVILIAVIAICLIPNRPQYATAKDAMYIRYRASEDWGWNGTNF